MTTSKLQAAMYCALQETNFGSLHDLQANEQTAPASRSQISTPPHAKQLPPCTVSPSPFCSPPQATREDINALGLDSPDSFLDQLHRTSTRPASSLHIIACRCRTILGQLSDPSAQHQHSVAGHNPIADHPNKARMAESGAVLASAGEVAHPASRRASPHTQQQGNLSGRLSRFADTQQAQPFPMAPAKQAAHQLAGYLAQHKQCIVGGYAVDPSGRQLQMPAPPYRPMKSLKSVLASRLQAGGSLPTDPTSLLEEAGWHTHLPWSAGHPVKQSPVFGAAQMPMGSTFPTPHQSSPLGPAAHMPLHSRAAQYAALPLLGVQQVGAMQPPAAVRLVGVQSGKSPSPTSTVTTVTEQQQLAEAPAVPPVDAVMGSPMMRPPPNTPEAMQSCLSGSVNSTLKTLGLTQHDIQQILRNAEAQLLLEKSNGSKLSVM